MSDLIDRQAAIDALAHEWDGMVTSVFDVIKSLPSAQPEQRWIPCSERLPEEGQGCLVCDKRHIFFDTFVGHGSWRWRVTDYEAWMPLPEPYREDGNEQ